MHIIFYGFGGTNRIHSNFFTLIPVTTLKKKPLLLSQLLSDRWGNGTRELKGLQQLRAIRLKSGTVELSLLHVHHVPPRKAPRYDSPERPSQPSLLLYLAEMYP